MKKILTLTLALMMALSLAACGGKDDPKPSGNNDPGTSQQEPSNTPDPGTSQQKEQPSNTPVDSQPTDGEDWQQIVKTTYGLDIAISDVWKYDNTDDLIGHKFFFNYTGGDFASDYEALCEYLFALTAEVGGEKGNYIYEDDAYPTIDAIPAMEIGTTKTLIPGWKYNFASQSVQIDIADYSDSASIAFIVDGDAK